MSRNTSWKKPLGLYEANEISKQKKVMQNNNVLCAECLIPYAATVMPDEKSYASAKCYSGYATPFLLVILLSVQILLFLNDYNNNLC